jgi:hypothetical protein
MNPPRGAFKEAARDPWRRLGEKTGVKLLDTAERRPRP